MKYRIANPNEDLGTHPIKRLRESFATEESAQGVSVEVDGQWHALWPWLQMQPRGLFSRNITTPAKDPSQAKEDGFRSPYIVSLLRMLSCVVMGWGILCLFGPAHEIVRCGIVAMSLWVIFSVIELLARIEFNTRR